MSIQGVDYAFPPWPSIKGLHDAGIVFACRYGGPGTAPKHLTSVEARSLSAAGIHVVANAEGSTGGLLGGRNVGASWASSAHKHFVGCGMPPDRPIYLSVDFDVTQQQWPSVADALRGAAAVLGPGRVGVYGGRHAIEWARRDGVAKWFWQTYAWSGGHWVPGNHIEQYRNNVDLAGAKVDLNRALKPDYGQWMIGDDMSWNEILPLPAKQFPELAGQEGETAGLLLAWTAARARRLEVEMAEIKATLAAIGQPVAAPVDMPALLAALRPELERAMRAVLGSLDEDKTTT